MNSYEIKKFIHENNQLFWYVKDDQKENISKELLVETILNYGNIDTIRKLFNIMGLENVAHIFHDSINKSQRRKNNYHEIILNYFTLYFKRNALPRIK